MSTEVASRIRLELDRVPDARVAIDRADLAVAAAALEHVGGAVLEALEARRVQLEIKQAEYDVLLRSHIALLDNDPNTRPSAPPVADDDAPLTTR